MIFVLNCWGENAQSNRPIKIFERPPQFSVKLFICKAEETSIINYDCNGDDVKIENRNIKLSFKSCKLMHSLLIYEDFQIKPNSTTTDVIYIKNEHCENGLNEINKTVTIYQQEILIESANGIVIPGIDNCNFISKTCIGNDGQRLFWEEIINLNNYGLVYKGEAEKILLEQNNTISTMFKIKFNENNVYIAIGALWPIDEECSFQSDHQNLIITICDDKSTKFKISDKNFTTYITTKKTFYIVEKNNSFFDALLLKTVLSDEKQVASNIDFYEKLFDLLTNIVFTIFIVCVTILSALTFIVFLKRVRLYSKILNKRNRVLVPVKVIISNSKPKNKN